MSLATADDRDDRLVGEPAGRRDPRPGRQADAVHHEAVDRCAPAHLDLTVWSRAEHPTSPVDPDFLDVLVIVEPQQGRSPATASMTVSTAAAVTDSIKETLREPSVIGAMRQHLSDHTDNS